MYHRFKWTKVSHRRNWISKEYEPLQPYYLLQLGCAVDAKTFIDVGANVGLYSVFMSQAVDQIVAYEANEALAKEVQDNFALNHIDGQIRRVAVSNHTGTVTFGIVSRYAGNSAVVDEEKSDQPYGTKILIEATRLDDELASSEGPLVLKIDVEGHELPVLEGADNTLRGQPCVIQIENFGGLADTFLLERGYRKLTSIGPDAYFTNIDKLDALTCFEKSTSAMIEANHERKSMTFGRGGLSIIVSGRVYEIVRKIAERLFRGRL